MMDRIADRDRKRPDLSRHHPGRARRTGTHRRRRDRRRRAADCRDRRSLSAVVCWTLSGSTSLAHGARTAKPLIVAISPNVATGRRLAVAWGVHCVIAEDAHDQDDMVDRACRYRASARGLRRPDNASVAGDRGCSARNARRHQHAAQWNSRRESNDTKVNRWISIRREATGIEQN